MKYCHQCHRMTAGQPLYCDHCGRSYGVKLCPRRHVNLRSALVCSQCGSPDLSTPHPEMPIWFAPAVVLASLLPGFVLILITLLLLLALFNIVLNAPEQIARLFMPAIGIVALWAAYLPVPQLIRTAMSRMWQRRSRHESTEE